MGLGQEQECGCGPQAAQRGSRPNRPLFILSAIVKWLWDARQGISICCLVILAVLAVGFSFAVVGTSEQEFSTFHMSALNSDFVPEGTGSRCVLRHSELGITL